MEYFREHNMYSEIDKLITPDILNYAKSKNMIISELLYAYKNIRQENEIKDIIISFINSYIIPKVDCLMSYTNSLDKCAMDEIVLCCEEYVNRIRCEEDTDEFSYKEPPFYDVLIISMFIIKKC